MRPVGVGSVAAHALGATTVVGLVARGPDVPAAFVAVTV